jgi:methylmalonyl-CoA/ethylmalonyl-CoA epimerase
MILDHLGIACTNLEAEIERYRAMHDVSVLVREEVASQKVRLAFISFENTLIELLEPLGSDGPLAGFIAKRGPGLHHMCYRVPNVAAEITRLQAIGVQMIDTVPRHGALDSKIGFIHPKSCGGVLTEICERSA